MILGAAFCPHPPLLVPSIAGAAAAEITDLLASCDEVVAAVIAAAPRIVVIGGAARSSEHAFSTGGSLSGFGPPDGRDDALPLSLTIGHWLLERARPDTDDIRLVAVANGGAEDLAMIGAADDAAVLVMGDGSARRSVKAPGYLDGRAFAFDDHVGAALAAGDAGALQALDAGLGADLLVAGVPAWRAAGRLLAARRWTGRIYYDDDPFGVNYRVATWRPA